MYYMNIQFQWKGDYNLTSSDYRIPSREAIQWAFHAHAACFSLLFPTNYRRGEQVIKAGTKKPYILLDTYMQDQDKPNQSGYAVW